MNDIELMRKDVEEIELKVLSAINNTDPHELFILGRELTSGIKRQGVKLMKLIYEIWKNWDSFNVDDDYRDVLQSELGVTVQTIEKYRSAWENIFVNPSIDMEVRERLYEKPVRELMLLAPAARDNTEQIDWEAVVNTTTEGEMRQIIHNVRGTNTSAGSSVILSMDRTGTLYYKLGLDGAPMPFGFLNVDMTDVSAQKAIRRVIDRSGIYER